MAVSSADAHGALLIRKPVGVSSFGAVDVLQKALGLKRADRPKMGHGGTLDPFATGLLVICVGRGVKLARYFLGSKKTYTATARLGQATPSGDPTLPVHERSERMPASLAQIQAAADAMRATPYLQTPPMFSAKKKDGVPLYELAREGLEVERQPKRCELHRFEVREFSAPDVRFEVVCSAGTYIRTLAQDLAARLGTLAHLTQLERTASGRFSLKDAWELEDVVQKTREGVAWTSLSCWVPFNAMLEGFEKAEISAEEQTALIQGRQQVLRTIVARHPSLSSGSAELATLYFGPELLAIARRENGSWGLERVFLPEG